MNEDLQYDENYLKICLDRAFNDSEVYCVPQGITRYDYGHTHSWWLRITRDNAQFCEHFYDGPSGGIEEGLRQAILRRHEILSFPVTMKILSSSALSSDPEQRIQRVTTKGNKQPYNGWKAKYYDAEHKVKSKLFSVLRDGEDGARLLAIEYTKKHHNKVIKLTKIPDLYKKDKYRKYSREEVKIFSSINSGSNSKGRLSKSLPTTHDPHAFEGDRKLVLHRQIERNRRLRQAKIEDFIQIHGKLFCELCCFSFIERFPFLKVDIIEIHHLTPLGTLESGQITKLSDLMLLCSNCHFVIHQGDPAEQMNEMRRCINEHAD